MATKFPMHCETLEFALKAHLQRTVLGDVKFSLCAHRVPNRRCGYKVIIVYEDKRHEFEFCDTEEDLKRMVIEATKEIGDIRLMLERA